MIFKRRTSNFAPNNTHSNCTEAAAARSVRIGLRIALNPTLLGVVVMLVLLVSAYSQEIDPAWYDPWAAPNKTVVSTRRRGRLVTKNEVKSDQRGTTGTGKKRQAPKQLAIASASRRLPRVR